MSVWEGGYLLLGCLLDWSIAHLTDFLYRVVLTIYLSTKLSGEIVLNTIFAPGNTKPLQAWGSVGAESLL